MIYHVDILPMRGMNLLYIGRMFYLDVRVAIHEGTLCQNVNISNLADQTSMRRHGNHD